MIKAIETVYNGYRFRSRLEARWAVFFDVSGIAYEYEMEGFDLDGVWYLPDFWFPKFECWGEVKPKELSRVEFEKCSKLPGGCLIFDGMPKSQQGYFCTFLKEWSVATYEEYLDKDDSMWRVYLPWSVGKGRLWYLFGGSASDYAEDSTFKDAEICARQARFEHGETPKIARLK